MSRTERLKPVVKLAGHKEKESASALAKAQDKLLQAQKRLQDIIDYRLNYSEMLQEKGKKSISANELCRYQSFFAQLDSALIQQQNAVQQAEFSVQEHINSWTKSKRKHQMIGKISQQIQQTEQIAKDKNEQKQMDDQASLQFFNKNKPKI
ncbi:MAG: flagellar export protein FliJ [Gammaproteobacteria bacterium CG22_combo_CG10-13_8_21_14_all_40_8]|nr:MAG: flagellar export protein FliJ [Gammaproteobacteria bacterium CG22_combo_CG10-13_8_21_14_all_40_8]